MTVRILAPVPDPVGGPAARRAATTELRHPEYRRDQPGLVSRFTHWLGDKLDRVFSGSGGSHALLLLLVVLGAVVIVVVARAGVPGRRRRTVDGAAVDPLAPVATSDHRRLAAQYAADGRRAEALREWLRAAVRTIEERGVLPPRPGRTGAATAREAGVALPTAADDLTRATTAFDEIWFGGRPATDADVQLGRAAAERVATARIDRGATAPAGPAVPW